MLSVGEFGREFTDEMTLLEFDVSSMCSERSGALVESKFLFFIFDAGEGERELFGGGVLRLVPPRFPVFGRVRRSWVL